MMVLNYDSHSPSTVLEPHQGLKNSLGRDHVPGPSSVSSVYIFYESFGPNFRPSSVSSVSGPSSVFEVQGRPPGWSKVENGTRAENGPHGTWPEIWAKTSVKIINGTHGTRPGHVTSAQPIVEPLV